MKCRFFAFAAMLFFAMQTNSQEKNYSGKFQITEDNGSPPAINTIKINLESSSSFSAVMHIKVGSVFILFPGKDKRDHSGDYTDISGKASGTVSPNRIEGTFNLTVVENEVGTISRNNVTAKITGTISGNSLIGEVIIGDGEEDPMIIPYSVVPAGDEKPELIFLAGKSPKVFNKGWIFGASFSLLDDNGQLVDLADKVEWSGSASFGPATGNKSRPVFNTVGINKLILSVNYNGKNYKAEYQVETVDNMLYGHIGSIAFCPADGHGGPSCPLKVAGPVTTGSNLVLAGDYPAARVGDKGIHAACADGNYFTISTGDPEVLIEGKPAAKIGISQTTHCGGMGTLIGGYDNAYLLYNSYGEIAGSGKEPGKMNEKKYLETGDVLKTGEKGLIAFPGNWLTGITVFPNSLLKILENSAEQIRMMLEQGAVMVNGNTAEGKKIQLVTKDLSFLPKGTKFLVLSDSTATILYVYSGKITVNEKSTGKITDIDSGYVYRYAGGQYSIDKMTAASAEKTVGDLMSTVDNKTIQINYPEQSDKEINKKENATNGLSFIQHYGIYIGAALVLVILAVYLSLRKKRK